MSIEKHLSIMIEDTFEETEDFKETKDFTPLMNKMIQKYMEVCWEGDASEAPKNLETKITAVISILENMQEQ